MRHVVASTAAKTKNEKGGGRGGGGAQISTPNQGQQAMRTRHPEIASCTEDKIILSQSL